MRLFTTCLRGGQGGGEKVDTLIKKKFFFSYIREIQKGSVAKSYMTNGLLIYG